MDNYDGSVVIKTGIDTEGFVAGSKELARDAQKAADEIKNISVQTRASINNQIASFSRANDAFREQEAEVERLRQSLVELQQTKVETDEYKAVSAELDKASAEMDKLLQKEREMIYLGKAGDGNAAWESLVDKIGIADERVVDLQKRLQDMRDAGEQYRPADTAAAEAKLAAAEQKHDTMLSSLNYKYTMLREKIRGLGQETANTHKTTQKHSGLTFKNLLKYSFGIRSVFVLFRRLRQVAKQALGVMAQNDPTFNKSISRLLTSFKQLKADIGTIVQPIVQAVAPVISTIFDKIHGISLGIASFFAAFVGQDYIEKATVSAYDYADALNDVSDSAEKALGSYDKLNVISDGDKDKKASLALTKDTVKYTKEALNDDSWTVKLGRSLGALWKQVTDAVTSLFDRLKKCEWFNDMVDTLKELLSDPNGLLILIGAFGIGKLLGAKLLSGIAASGFSNGVLGLIPKTATIAVTALVAYKTGNAIYENLPDAVKDGLGEFLYNLWGDPDDAGDGFVGYLADLLRGKEDLIRDGDVFNPFTESFEDAPEMIKERYLDPFIKASNDPRLDEAREEMYGKLFWKDSPSAFSDLAGIISDHIKNTFNRKKPLDILGKQREKEIEKRFKEIGKGAGNEFLDSALGKKSAIGGSSRSAIHKEAMAQFETLGLRAQESFQNGIKRTQGTERAFSEGVGKIISSVNGQTFYDKGMSVTTDFFGGMKVASASGAETAKAELNKSISNIGNGISDLPLKSKGQSIASSFTTAISSFVSGAGEAIKNTINRMLSTARDGVNSDVLYDKGTNVGTAFGNGVNAGLGNNAQTFASRIATSVKDIVTRAKNSITTDDFVTKGKSLGEGLSNGLIQSIANSGQNMAKTLVEKVLNAVTSAYNVAVPASTMLTSLLNGTKVPSVVGSTMATQSTSQTINLTLDGKVVSQVVWDNTNKVYKQTGKTALLA